MTYQTKTRRSRKAGALTVIPPAPAMKLTPELERLVDMLSYMRPDHSPTDWEFIGKFIVRPGCEIDDAGNIWIKVGDSPIMWSCHTDTVHHKSGRQTVIVDGYRARVLGSDALGADDTAGCWLMTEMIDAGIPGLYAFHRGEEVGGIGSAWAAKHQQARLKGIEFCIALDRKGYNSVITHQFSTRSCSDEFALTLAGILGGEYEPDSTGLFTDSANYTEIISECTNLSVGYDGAHGPTESLDLVFIQALRDQLIAADFSSLVAKREPGSWDPLDDDDWTDYKLGGHNHHGGQEEVWEPAKARARKHPLARLPYASRNMIDFVRSHPDEVADMLEFDGWDTQSLAEYLNIEVEEAI